MKTSVSNRKPIPRVEITIVDLGPHGRQFSDQLYNFIRKTVDSGRDFRWLADNIHRTVLTEIVRLLNLPPVEALDALQRFPSSQAVRRTLSMYEYRELDVIYDFCRQWGLTLFQRVRDQLKPQPMVMGYVFERAGLNYIVIRQVNWYDNLEQRVQGNSVVRENRWFNNLFPDVEDPCLRQ